jgi:hypothetical protein
MPPQFGDSDPGYTGWVAPGTNVHQIISMIEPQFLTEAATARGFDDKAVTSTEL